MKTSMKGKLEALVKRIDVLNTELSHEDVTKDIERYKKISKEHSDITPIVEIYKNSDTTWSVGLPCERIITKPNSKDTHKQCRIYKKTDPLSPPMNSLTLEKVEEMFKVIAKEL